MTRQEVEAWGLVGAGAVIIILLLLEYPGAAPTNTNVILSEPAPGEPQQYVVVPPDNPNQPIAPWQISFPPIPQPEFNVQIAQPCSCACSEAQEIQDQNFGGSVNALNQMLASGTINNAATYFSEIPYQDLFATNQTGIDQFTEGQGLPAPIPVQNVFTPGYTSLVGGGSLSYTFLGAPVE